MKTKLGLAELLERQDTSIQYFNPIWAEGEENERIKSGTSWSDSEKQQIENQNRIPYSISMMTTKLNQIMSYQQNNRTDFRLKAVINPLEEVTATIGNVIFKDFESRNNFKYLESEVFESGVSVKYGVVGIYVDKDEYLNDIIKVRNVDYRNFMFDPNAVEYTKSDALYMTEFTRVYRFQLVEEYGKKAFDPASNFQYTWGRNNAFFILSSDRDRMNDLIAKFTHYEKVLRDYYYVVFNDYAQNQEVVEKFRNRWQAEERLRELEIPYLLNDMEVGKGEVVKIQKEMLDKYVFTIEGILEYEETELECFPYAVYQSFHFQDKFWCMADLLKPMQKWIDRSVSQIDYALGKDIKNVYELAVGQLADGLTFEQALQHMEDSGVIPVKMTGAINAVRSQGINPQWIQMMTVMQTYLEDLAGGRSFQGLSEGKNESGVAIARKQQSGELIAGLFMDNFKRWKQDLGEKLLWFFDKYDNAERVIKVGGGDLSPEMIQVLQQVGSYEPSMTEIHNGYLKINTHPLTTLRNSKFALVVSESPASDTKKAQKLGQIAVAAQLNPNIAQIPAFTELLLDTLDLDYDVKVKLTEGYKQFLQAQAEAAKAEADQDKKNQDEKNQIDAAKAVSSIINSTQKGAS